jgi:alkylhydroperoxidase/carboxymuconolactone decarboxylase family protein YurZ
MTSFKHKNVAFQALRIQKALCSPGTNADDVSKVMLIQAALARNGASSDAIANAINSILSGHQTDLESVSKAIRGALDVDGVVLQDDVTGAAAMAKIIQSGKARGLRDVLDRIEKGVASDEDVLAILKDALASGAVDVKALAKAAAIEKLLARCGVKPETVAMAMQLQKSLLESGMPVHEIANAMGLAMGLGGKGAARKAHNNQVDSISGQNGQNGPDDGLDETGSAADELGDALSELISKGLFGSDVAAAIDFTKAVESGADIPPEAVRLLKKAMKQRRGSVENVAETLVNTLASNGESHENIASAMVRALKATGASPEDIARTLTQALGKIGASNEEIAHVMAKAMAESGASGKYYIRFSCGLKFHVVS